MSGLVLFGGMGADDQWMWIGECEIYVACQYELGKLVSKCDFPLMTNLFDTL
jgi:hypothetical protein